MKHTKLRSIISAKVVTIKSETLLGEALEIMANKSVSSLVVVDEAVRPIGIFTEHDALSCIAEKYSKNTPLLKVMSHGVVTVTLDEDIHDAYAVMSARGFRHIVVVDSEGALAGLASQGDFLRHIGLEQFGKLKITKEVMNKSLLMIDTSLTLEEAAQQMNERGVDYAIVMEKGFPYGLINERDITLQMAKTGDAKTAVKELWHTDYPTIHEATSLHDAAAMMEKHGVHQLIVLDDQQALVGLLGRDEVLRAIHGGYFEFLIKLVDEKSTAMSQLAVKQKLYEDQAIFLRTLVNTIPDLIWMKDLEGKYLACNPKFERLYDTKEADIVGKDDFAFVSPELARFFQDNDRKAIEEEGARANEEFLTFADGSYEGLFDTIKTPMRDAHGNVIGVLGIARDVTARKEKEQEIQKVQELAHVGTWEWDILRNEFTGSDEVYRIFSIPLGQKVSLEELLTLIVEEDREAFHQEMMEMLSGQVPEFSYRIVDGSGRVKWIESSATTFFDKENRPYKAIGLTRDVTERKLHEQKLELLANNDVLTGLANRPFLLVHLKNILEKAARDDRMIALLMFDLDRFKDVNDSFGHQAGDALLVNVAQRFHERMREGDLIARLGGDEFAVVLDNLVHIEDAGRIAQEMIAALGVEYDLGEGLKVHVGSSAGIVVSPNHGNDAQALLQFADAALYRAKDEGRGIYRYYTDELTEAARKRVECETQLRRAVENEEFEVYYQPQVHIATGRIVGAEALVRWNDPVRGIISPVLFIPLAEETGLIGQIGEWVLNETCRQGKIWLDAGHRLTLAVNVSAHQMRHQDVLKMVDHALKKSGYKAEHLELELTESALMDREEELVEVLHILRARGIRLAIDDFGTGYSSLSYLKRFPIDVLKIDKSFVDDIPFEKDDMAIVTAIIAMGKALGFQVLAEGTERQEQIDFLAERGCTMYQGYFKSQPVPAAAFEKLLS